MPKPSTTHNPRLKSNLTRFQFRAWLIARLPSAKACFGVALAAILLIFSFPNPELWFLSWVSLVPFLLVVARQPRPWPTFVLGWLFGSIFFYGSCYWLTYSMIHFGGIPRIIAFAMLVPGAVLLGIFPAFFSTIVALIVKKWGTAAVLLAPFVWTALEWGRLETTGQLWNAIGYSQASHPQLIQSARFGGVYAVGFLIVTANSAFAVALIKRSRNCIALSMFSMALVVATILLMNNSARSMEGAVSDAVVIAIQPNVPMDLFKSADEMADLNKRHFEMSEATLRSLPKDDLPRLLIWPESPMNFTYGTDERLRQKLMQLARMHHTSILLNSQEVAPNDGLYNSAMLINQEGSLVSQYDKIRLLPFGEYVPLPQWLPGASVLRGIVGDFTPGSNYRLMDVGKVRIGVFICIESAYPSIAREFAYEGADVLINISNDGYLGPTAVRRQHLANAVFRAVENRRRVIRVTNTGITASISADGEVRDATPSFSEEVRVWRIGRANGPTSTYTRYGDLFAAACAAVTLFALLSLFLSSRNLRKRRG